MGCCRLLALGLGCAVAAPALGADPVKEPWEDGITPRLPVRVGAEFRSAALLEGDRIGFGRVTAGVNFGWRLAEDRGSVALSIDADGLAAWFADGRTATTPRTLRPTLWFLFSQDAHTYGLGVVTQVPFGAGTRWYQLSPSENVPLYALTQHAVLDFDVVQVTTEVQLGVAVPAPGQERLDGVITAAASAPLANDQLAIGAGATLRSRGGWTVNATLRARPVEGLEIGLVGAAHQRRWQPVSLYPALQIKVYAPRPPG